MGCTPLQCVHRGVGSPAPRVKRCSRLQANGKSGAEVRKSRPVAVFLSEAWAATLHGYPQLRAVGWGPHQAGIETECGRAVSIASGRP
jgi:hypothetical protein